MSEHIPGLGCRCSAWSQNECCCDGVDWRSVREVELEAKLEASVAAHNEIFNQLGKSEAEIDALRAKVERLEKENELLRWGVSPDKWPHIEQELAALEPPTGEG